jgi:alkaline phosphatase
MIWGGVGETVAAVESPAAPAQSLILFIGDGVDDHQLTIARNYLFGNVAAADGFSFDRFDARAAAVVQTVSEQDGVTPVYVGDSASGGTAIAAGTVTSRGRIATTARTDRDVPTVLELAQAAGLRTGLVTTSSITDATPASFVAHIALRYCEGPGDMAGMRGGVRTGCPDDVSTAGGPGSIAEQIAASGVDVLLGGGTKPFSQPTASGETPLQAARAAGYSVVEDRAGLLGADAKRPLLGLFGPGTLPVEWAAQGGAQAEPVRVSATGEIVYPEAQTCVPNPDFGNRPTLEEMTRKAIELLGADGARFFLMVESASIDKQAHARQACGQIGETQALDRSVQAALDFAETHPETALLVASDHGHAAQIVPIPSMFAALPPMLGPQLPPGRVAVVKMPRGGVMGVSYGSNQGYAEEHTGTQTPVFGQGPGTESVRGLIRQADLFDVMRRALGLEVSPPQP